MALLTGDDQPIGPIPDIPEFGTPGWRGFHGFYETGATSPLRAVGGHPPPRRGRGAPLIAMPGLSSVSGDLRPCRRICA